MEETITITKKERDQLVEDQRFLHALQGAGVDNWEGYDYALELLEEDAKSLKKRKNKFHDN